MSGTDELWKAATHYLRFVSPPKNFNPLEVSVIQRNRVTQREGLQLRLIYSKGLAHTMLDTGELTTGQWARDPGRSDVSALRQSS